ncbi:phosphoinositide 3-kinase regulatory subunit 5-like isoform X2 [Labrus mixtus]|nr:phosphoinositide 3-kinase regulatory subunit 5-like isoform X2 [Labrus mixtus]
MEQSGCTEDRIEHVLERCLSGLGLDAPDKQLWNAGLCINNWCLEELVKREPRNFLILLQKILQKAREVIQQVQYEVVVPLTLLFSSSLLKAPYVSADSGILQDAYLVFHSFLSWPEPCCSASRRLLNVIQQELRAPGVSFQRLIRSEQGVSPGTHCSKTMTVLLVSPDDNAPKEVQSVSEQLSRSKTSSRDVCVLLILQGLQAALGPKLDLQTLHSVLQTKQPEELQQLMEAVTDSVERAAATPDLSTARQSLRLSMERVAESLSAPAGGRTHTGSIETFTLPFPKCHACCWENDNFDILNHILAAESDLNSPSACFLKTDEEDEDINDVSVDEEDELDADRIEQEFLDNRVSYASSSSRDSGNYLSSSWSVFSTPSGSSGVESDFSEDTTQDDAEEGREDQPKLRKKPKKKSRSLLGVERFSSLFRTPRSPSICRRAQSLGYRGDITKDVQRSGSKLKHSSSLSRKVHPLQTPVAPSDDLSPQKHMCVRRRPILSCDEGDVLVKVVVFGGDREAGRLARAYSDLQQRESKCPRLTKTCRLQFYFVPTRRKTSGSHTASNKTAAVECNGSMQEDSTTDIAQLLGRIDPWYERNVLNLLSLSSDVLSQYPTQTSSKEGDESVNGCSSERLPLLADLLIYYCRHAEQQVLVQLYQAELTLAGGERRREVFIHSLELGHSAGTRAVKAMGSASKRFGIDKEREAVPLSLSVSYNKVAISGRSQWIETEMVCTSINLHKSCMKPEQSDSRSDSLQLTMTEVLKRQCSKSKKGFNQHISVSEVKVDKVQVISGDDGTTFAVCLDQDEKKFIQSVTRCEVSLCCKPGRGSDWRSFKPTPGQVQPLHPSYCSLLCLPVTSFSSTHT